MTNVAGNASPLPRLGLVVTTMGAGQMVLLTQVPVISDLCGLGVASIGTIVAIGTLCLMLAGPVWGGISDRRGRKSVVLTGLTGTLLAQALFVGLLLMMAADRLAGVPALVLLGATRVLYGLSAAGVYPACQAWAAESGGADRRLASLSSLSAAANLGRAVGPVLALPALAAGALWPLAWLIALPALALLAAAPVPATAARPASAAPGLGLNPRLAALFAVALLSTAAVGQLQVMLGPALGDYYGLGTRAASSATAVLLLGVAAIGGLVQWTVVRRLQAPAVSLAAGAVLMVAGLAWLWPALGTLQAAGALAVLVAGLAALAPGYSALASLATPAERRGRLFGLLALMHTAGYTVGFGVGGWVYSTVPAAPLAGVVLCVGLLAGAAVLALRAPTGAGARAEAPSA